MIEAPASKARARDVRLGRVDRDQDVRRTAQLLNHGNDTPQLFIFRHRLSARPRRLAADVENRRAIARHLQPMLDRFAGIEKLSAIGKRIGRDVKHAHDQGAAREIDRLVSNFPARLGHEVQTITRRWLFDLIAASILLFS